MAKKIVKCSECGKEISRITWNYQHKRPISEFFCSTTCKGIWQVKQREAKGFTKDWLIEQYVNQKKSSNQIAREIGRDSKRVWEWIRFYGIETRPRGTDYGQSFKAGMVGTMLGKKHSAETKEKIRQKALKDGRRPWGKDNDPYWKGKTGKDHPSWKGGATPERQAFYSSEEWKDAVKKVWARDNAFCQRCGKHHNEEIERGNFDIHHITSFQVKELRAEVSNLVLVCKPCHKWIHSKKNVEKDFLK